MIYSELPYQVDQPHAHDFDVAVAVQMEERGVDPIDQVRTEGKIYEIVELKVLKISYV